MRKLLAIAVIILSLNADLSSRQWIVFFAKEGFFDGIIRQSFGHAYVGLIKEDPMTGNNILLGCWGFYPRGGIRSEGFVGYMEGEIRDDWKSMRDDGLIVEISDKELKKCLRLKKFWEKQAYSLRTNNCLHFIKNFGANIAKLKLPRGFFLLPSSYLSALKNENKNIAYNEPINNLITKENFITRSRHYLKAKHKIIRDNKIILFKPRNHKADSLQKAIKQNKSTK